MTLHLRTYGALLIFLLVACSLSAQVSSTITITGAVSDPSGAVIPDADVTVTNNATRVETKLNTNASGNFVATGLAAGTYTVQIAKEGFRTYVQNSVTVNSAETRAVTAVLTVGDAGQQIQVEATAAQVQTVTADMTSVVASQQVSNLPLNGRNFSSLAVLMPGVVNTAAGSGMGSGGFSTQTSLSINGMGSGSGTMYFMDGIWNMNTGNGRQLGITPDPDMIQEVRVLQSNFGVKFALMGASAVLVETKSGTSTLHGSAFEYFRNTDLNARNAFAKVVPTLHQNMFGYSLGGPVYIPKINPHKDRTFFFVHQQFIRAIVGQTIGTITPTQAMRNGTFTTPITDPTTGLPFPQTSPGVYQIPAARINPNATVFLNALAPLPNAAGASNYINSAPINTRQRDDEYRIDHSLTADGKFRLMGAYYIENQTSNQPTATFPTTTALAGTIAPQYATNAQQFYTPYQAAKVELTWLVTPSMVNQARVTMNRYMASVYAAPGTKWLLSDLPEFKQTLPRADPLGRLPLVTFGNGYPAIGTVGFTGWRNGSDLDNAVADDWSWNHGKHFIEAGFSVLTNTKRQTATFYTQGLWNFSGRFTGNAIADFLLGTSTSFQQVSNLPRIYNHRTWESHYVQDQWKVTPRLTLSLGIRQSFIPLMNTYPEGTEPYFSARAFDPAKAPTILQNGTIVATPNYDPLNGILLNCINGQSCNNRADKQWFLIPQFGLAWNVFGDGKTSFRGGYSGTTAGNISSHGGATCCFGNYPVVTTTNLVNPLFPNPTGTAPAPPTVANFTTMGPDMVAGRIHSFSLSLEHEFQGGWLASVAGAGSLVRHMPNQLNINAPPPTGGFDYNPAINTGGSPYFYAPYKGFGAINQANATLTANYTAFMLNLRHPVGHGLFFTAAYTWSHAISAFRQPYMFGGGVTGQNPYNWRADVGNSLTNVPQVFNSTIVYDLPFFKGAHGWERFLLSGWKLNEIVTIQSGTSLDPGLSVANQGLATRPDVVGALSYPKQVGQWFSPATFAKPAAGFYGNAGTGIIRGPGLIVFDTGLYKDFAVTERHIFELRAEIFNTFNHTNFSTVNTTFGSPTFGFVTAARDPRIIELALRYRF